jgi:hypothetical protein
MSNRESESAQDTAGGRTTGKQRGIEQLATTFSFTLVDPEDDSEDLDEGDTEVWVVARRATDRPRPMRQWASEQQEGGSQTTDDAETA